MRVRLVWGVRLLIALAILLFLSKRLHNLLTQLELDTIAFDPLWAIVSFAILLSHRTLLVFPWWILYRAAAQVKASFRDSWTLFQISQLGRYLPGKVGQFVWMASLARGFGIQKTLAVIVSCLQIVFQCILGCIIGIPVLQNTELLVFQNWIDDFLMTSPLWIFVGTLGFLLIVGGGLYAKKRIKELIPQFAEYRNTLFSVSRVLYLIASYLLIWGLLGVAFFLFIKGFVSTISISQLPMVISTCAMAWCIGFLSFLTPSGLGIREGFLSLMLTTVGLTPTTASLVALLSRLWTLGAEIFLGGLACGSYFRHRRIQHN